MEKKVLKIIKKVISYTVKATLNDEIVYIVSNEKLPTDCWVVTEKYFIDNYEEA